MVFKGRPAAAHGQCGRRQTNRTHNMLLQIYGGRKLKQESKQGGSAWRRTVASFTPLVLLGMLRLIAIKGSNYHEVSPHAFAPAVPSRKHATLCNIHSVTHSLGRNRRLVQRDHVREAGASRGGVAWGSAWQEAGPPVAVSASPLPPAVLTAIHLMNRPEGVLGSTDRTRDAALGEARSLGPSSKCARSGCIGVGGERRGVRAASCSGDGVEEQRLGNVETQPRRQTEDAGGRAGGQGVLCRRCESDEWRKSDAEDEVR